MPESGWKKLTAEEVRLAKQWYEDGVVPSECAERLGRDKSTLTRHLVKKVAMKKQGAPKKLTEAEVDYLERRLDELIRKANGEYHITAAILKSKTRCKASEATIQRELHKRNIYFRKNREKPLLTEADVKERYAFSKKWRGKTSAWWNRVIKGYIDGKWYKVYLTQAMRSLAAKHTTWGSYRSPGKGLDGAYVKPKKEYKKNNTGAKSSLVMAGVGNGKVLMWHTVPSGRWSGQAAADMYEKALRPCLEKAWVSKGRFTVLEDNDPTGFKSTKGREAKERARIDVFQIPPRSPDLSVMDYAIWKEVNRRMRSQEQTWKGKRRETREQYLSRLRKTALRLPASFIKKSIGDMARRCERLYQAKGSYFEEGGRRGC
jgi:hypothetical protein